MENGFPYQVGKKITESFNVEEKNMESSKNVKLVHSCSSYGFYDGLNSLGMDFTNENQYYSSSWFQLS